MVRCDLCPVLGDFFFGGCTGLVLYRVFRVEFSPICREWALQELVGDKSGALWYDSLMARSQKIRCREIAAYAEKVGWLKRPKKCQGCGDQVKLDRHHERYDEPLEVTWLCTRCHSRIEGAKRRRKSKGSKG